ncbi:helix-turn-helix transcriptional regulator (plasmid) [Rossellomorea sp. AcN35-11]|nr:helix-turn-helix transcriptional regulator [Rossellomorea aquimaris]WJV32181.1 helix-turn-helix transcriptional regulator [Rossellomorea sp. AcN35-11]
MNKNTVLKEVKSMGLASKKKKDLVRLSGVILDNICGSCPVPDQIKSKYDSVNEQVRGEVNRHCIQNCEVGKALGIIGLHLTDDYEIFISEEEKEVVAKNLKYLRKLSGKPACKVAKDAGMDNRKYHKYENAKVRANMENLKKLSDYYGLAVEELHTKLLEEEQGHKQLALDLSV